MTLASQTDTVTQPESVDSPPGPRILIIRSASRVFPKTLDALKREFPEAGISVLAAPSSVASLRMEGRISEILPLPEGRQISRWSFGKTARRELRRRNFDLAVVLYNVDHGWGYANVETLALDSGAKEIRGYFPDGHYRHLTRGAIVRHALKEHTAFGWVLLNVLASVIQLALFGTAMLWVSLKSRLTFSGHGKGAGQ